MPQMCRRALPEVVSHAAGRQELHHQHCQQGIIIVASSVVIVHTEDGDRCIMERGTRVLVCQAQMPKRNDLRWSLPLVIDRSHVGHRRKLRGFNLQGTVR